MFGRSVPRPVIVVVAIAIILVASVIASAHGKRATTTESFSDNSERRELIILAEWGMCNRLRCFNVAYELAMHTGRALVLINESKHYEKFWQGDWKQLIELPDGAPHVRFEPLSYLVDLGDRAHAVGKPLDDCGVSLSLKTLMERPGAGDKAFLMIKTCEIRCPKQGDVHIRNLFYKRIKPTRMIMDRVSQPLAFIRKEGCIGVHIRQGNIPDYEQGYFFGPWKKKDGGDGDGGDDGDGDGGDDGDESSRLPVLCCFDDQGKNKSPCPKAAPGIERFVAAMRKQGADAKFFVCSDRPGCMVFLESMFPQRVFYTSKAIERETDFVRGFCDWYCLGHCRKLLLSSPSSFSIEAAKLNDVPCEFIDP